ncbi:MAG: hypothetical protein SOU19_02565 [Candidatus Caccosoma sp.]|nr:hypothetical protein [Candidatus Caccosoma sp.]
MNILYINYLINYLFFFFKAIPATNNNETNPIVALPLQPFLLSLGFSLLSLEVDVSDDEGLLLDGCSLTSLEGSLLGSIDGSTLGSSFISSILEISSFVSAIICFTCSMSVISSSSAIALL